MFGHLFNLQEEEERQKGREGKFCTHSLTHHSLTPQVPLAWVNQPLFDYRNQLHIGTHSLSCWIVSPEDPLEDTLNPIGGCWPHPMAVVTLSIGTVVTNSNSTDAPTITIYYKDYGSTPVVYPSMKEVLAVASDEMSEV